MNPTVELHCPVCDSNQLTITEKGLMGQTSMACKTCGYTFKSSEAKVEEVSAVQETTATNSDAAANPGEFDKQLMDLLQQKGKIYAVKFCHQTKGWNLKESKDYVDNLAGKHGIKGKEGCFVATACYGDYNAPEVMVLRRYRDNILSQHVWGRIFIRLYYNISPMLSRLIARSERAKRFIRNYFVSPLVSNLQRKMK